MHPVDWLIVIVFCGISLAIGLVFSRRAGRDLESYFLSNRSLGWWLAGTSIVATAFSSDTPLLITGMVRQRGVWGVWEVWALGISTMLAVFVFSKLWKRANVMTEVELAERRYSGSGAAFLRGFKAVYWGLFYNCYIMGVWPVNGMTKVMQEATNFDRKTLIIGCVILGTVYTSLSGLWGVVLTDAFQFVWAMAGAVILAVAAVNAVGGLSALVERLSDTTALHVFPPMPLPGTPFLESPAGWLLGLILVQWWAWKNADGGGVVVQRLVSCRDERQAMLSLLWFNIAHYCLRSWPWILTALASIILVPNAALQAPAAAGNFIDHERAYPRLLMLLMPTGWRGVLVASFFAAFLSTFSTQLNWGASYLLNDVYKRFLNRRASERHYLRVARLLPYTLAAGAVAVAFATQSIGGAFTLVLNLTAGIGPVLLLRWFWWRINAWSEIAAMAASLPVLLLRPRVLQWLGLPAASLPQLLFMVLGTACVWLPVTLLTAPVEPSKLRQFYQAVRPPGWWGAAGGRGAGYIGWSADLRRWVIGSVALLASTIGPLDIWLGRPMAGWMWCGVAVAGWALSLTEVLRPPARRRSSP